MYVWFRIVNADDILIARLLALYEVLIFKGLTAPWFNKKHVVSPDVAVSLFNVISVTFSLSVLLKRLWLSWAAKFRIMHLLHIQEILPLELSCYQASL